MTAAGPITASPSSGSARVVRLFAVPERHLAIWIVGWIALAAAVLGVLVPLLSHGPAVTFVEVTVVFRIVGGAFAACGLVVGQVVPSQQQGPVGVPEQVCVGNGDDLAVTSTYGGRGGSFQ